MDALFGGASSKSENMLTKFYESIKQHMTIVNLVTTGLIILFAVTIFLYMFPSVLKVKEGFSTVSVDPVNHPKCFSRDAEAQRLLAEVQAAGPSTPEGIQWIDEFRLILSKFLCVDADITGSGSGVYSTMDLQFNTFHDMEPVASFVGRCLNRSLKERDINLTLEKLETRGAELLKGMTMVKQEQKELWVASLHNIAMRTSQAIHRVCLMPVASLDRPAGPRDPGFYDTSKGLSKPASYQEMGNVHHL